MLPLALLMLCLAGLASPRAAHAAGTIAGTTITDTVTMTYQQGGPSQQETVSSSFKVDRAVNFTVTKLADASIAAGQTNASVLYLVSNSSNTYLRFSLAPASRPTNSWNMNNVRLYRDINGSGLWDAGDTLYGDASTFGDVLSGASVTILIVGDAPASPGPQPSQYDLVATAVDAGSLNTAVQTTGPDTGNVDTVFIDAAGSATNDTARDGKHSAVALFSASAADLGLTKSVEVRDQWGGNRPIPGATLRYTITATMAPSGQANNVMIADPLPANTVYVPNSLTLNGTPLSDAVDGDAGDVGGSTPDTVTVRLGNLNGSSPVQTVTFEVRIQ
jgi:uncharacterized repeat protein (TIGR01451 family)